MLDNYSSSVETHAQHCSVWLMLQRPFFFFCTQACSLPLANFYAGLLGVSDHRIPDYCSFNVYSNMDSTCQYIVSFFQHKIIITDSVELRTMILSTKQNLGYVSVT
jgi:hypothetical protein